MGVVKKQTVTLGWLNSAANANTLNAGDFYIVERDGTYQATSGNTFVKVEQAEIQPLPDFGSAAFADAGDFATAAQGVKANSAVQPNGVKTVNGQSILGSGNIVINTDAPLWVSGTTYAAGKYVVSPLSSHIYMRRTAGAGATDPANDKTNWRLLGAGGIKSIQKGRSLVNSSGATIAISTVFPAACIVEVSQSGVNNDGVVQNALVDFTLSATSLLITRTAAGNNANYLWKITEYWS